jgi:lipopolysaccharide/colanic/teichoic acid biosynthesis glycosyltransferase
MNNGATALQTAAEEERASPAETRAEDYAIPAWKRVFDGALILVSSPIWLPVMIAIMVGIKLSSRGPVFYRQERIGYRGGRFMIFKFRTMKVNVETRVHESYFEALMQTDSPMTKLDANGDPRLIGCGRFLRAAGLDELPQLFNILRGEMKKRERTRVGAR